MDDSYSILSSVHKDEKAKTNRARYASPGS